MTHEMDVNLLIRSTRLFRKLLHNNIESCRDMLIWEPFMSYLMDKFAGYNGSGHWVVYKIFGCWNTPDLVWLDDYGEVKMGQTITIDEFNDNVNNNCGRGINVGLSGFFSSPDYGPTILTEIDNAHRRRQRARQSQDEVEPWPFPPAWMGKIYECWIPRSDIGQLCIPYENDLLHAGKLRVRRLLISRQIPWSEVYGVTLDRMETLIDEQDHWDSLLADLVTEWFGEKEMQEILWKDAGYDGICGKMIGVNNG